jgi:hypothetical protein
MADKKKKSSAAKRPTVPEAERVPDLTAPTPMEAPKYEPMSVDDFIKFMNAGYDIQLARAPEVAAMQRAQAPYFAQTASQLLNQYNPRFRRAYGALGNRIMEGLAAGYELGPGLGREVTQAIRGAQTARGNILGAAPTAQEAFGTGQAALNLYNMRLGQAQNYLQGRNPMDMMSQVMGSFINPSQVYVNQGLGATAAIASGQQGQQYNQTVQQGYSSFQNALQNYNQNLIGATTANNEGLFNTYDRQAESWMYDEAVRRGLYSTPSLGGGGGMGGMMGGMMSGIGGGIASGIGIAAAGGSATAAIGGGAAAAISAAGAAICWLARRCLPDRWEQFQRYLFTDASEKLRRLYIYNARRLAREISEDEAIEIGGLMDDCLNLRALA